MLSPIRAVMLSSIAGLALSVDSVAQTLTGIDVGSPSQAGSLISSNDASGKKVYVVTGGGGDIWNSSDNCYFAYTPITNDFDYVVRVSSLVGNSGDGGWSKAELMVRLDDGSGVPQGGDPFIANMVNRPSSDTANGAPAGVNNRGPQFRPIRDMGCSWTSPNPAYPPQPPNDWIRMERVGNVFYLYTSNDGKTWNMYNPWNPQGFDTSGSWPPGADNSSYSFFTNAWPSKVLLGLAVTAHNDADISVATFNDFGPYTQTPIAIATQPPATLAVSANNKLSLSVGATGDPVHYQWYKDNSPIAQAVDSKYEIALAKISDSGTYKVRVFGGGKEIYSANSVVTVTQDTTPPTVTGYTPVSFTTLNIDYSEPVTDTALTAGNYKLDQGLTVSAVSRISANSVQLTTSKMGEGLTYNLTINGVQDTAIPANTIAANTKVTFLSVVFALGWCTYERWDGDTTDIATFSDAITAGTQGAPTVTSSLSQFDGPWGAGDNYNSMKYGWFVPPVSTNYVFFIAADDQANLYLSTDDTAANKKLIAQEGGWSNQYQWQTVGSGDSTTKRSDQFGGNEWGATIALTAGKRYFIQITHHEGGGGDGAGATYVYEGQGDPAQSSAGMFLLGNVIGSYLNPNGATVDISKQPADTTGVDGKQVMFSVTATGASLYGNTVTYQWQKAAPGSSTFANIAGATASTYKTPILALSDNGTKFQVICSVPALSKASSAATLTVVPDTFPPVPSASTVVRNDGVLEVGVGFDESVDPSTLVAGNFSLVGGGTITTFKVATNSYGDYAGVVLDTTGLNTGAGYQVNVKNVKDLKGNAIPAAGVNAAFTVGTAGWANTGTQVAPGQVVPVGAGGFDILNGGRTEWGTYDEATIAYVKKTNDFDVRVQVIYAEPGSQWSRVGLMARNNLNVGEPTDDRNLSDGTGAASAYAQTHVNPNQTLASSGRWPSTETVQPVNPTPNNGHEQNCRLTKGAATTGWGSPATAPVYPDVWLRLQRVGTNIFGYRSEDGENWIAQGSVSLTDQQPDMFVGPFLTIETGNIWNSADFDVWGPYNPKYDMLFVAQFRNFGDVPQVGPSLGSLTIKLSGTSVTISWTGAGTLQSSSKVGTGATWTDVTGVTGTTYTTTASGAAAYYRLKQ